MLSKYRILVFIFFCLSFRISIAQSQVRIIGQFIGVKSGQIHSVSIKAAFIKNEGTAIPVSDLGFFSGTIDADQSGIATLSFQNYSYSFVIAHEHSWVGTI